MTRLRREAEVVAQCREEDFLVAEAIFVKDTPLAPVSDPPTGVFLPTSSLSLEVTSKVEGIAQPRGGGGG